QHQIGTLVLTYQAMNMRANQAIAIAFAIATFGCGEDTLFSDVGAGAAGGAGGATNGGGMAGGPSTCVPGTTMPCYSGPPRTEGVGICRSGDVICQPNGEFGPCIGEVVPVAAQC